MIDGYAYILPHAGWVNLGFYKGAELPDPKALLEGTGRADAAREDTLRR